MDTLKDKVVGGWYGMAVGDAMGLAARGLKPETVRQLFGQMDGFKDVRPFLGKGVKRFRMQGLYGAQTQSALVAADSLLRNKAGGVEEISALLVQLAADGPEHYLGVYRHPEGGFRQRVGSLTGGPSPGDSDHDRSDAAFAAMGIPLGLIFRDREETGIRLGVAAGLLMSRNLCEVTGVALSGHLASRLIGLDTDESASSLPEDQAQRILSDAVECCGNAEACYAAAAPHLWTEIPDAQRGALGKTLKGLSENWNMKWEDLLDWICRNASSLLKTKITHPAQGYVLTLFPLALALVVREGAGFGPVLTRGLNMGKEADKLGILIGAWAGALWGYSLIPESWRSGLVNGKEIRLRGESLFSGQLPKSAGDLYEMELGLTAKEYEMGKKFFPKTARKFTRPTPRPVLSWEADEPEIPEKSDVVRWRKFQKDKTRSKRDRRKHLDVDNADY